jgi:hypothetical protein
MCEYVNRQQSAYQAGDCALVDYGEFYYLYVYTGYQDMVAKMRGGELHGFTILLLMPENVFATGHVDTGIVDAAMRVWWYDYGCQEADDGMRWRERMFADGRRVWVRD